MDHRVCVLLNTFETHDVRRLVLTRPAGFAFGPGQAVDLALDHPDWRTETRPFTPTSVPTDRALEFVIKVYAAHEDVTALLGTLRPGAELLMSAPYGALRYRGPGVFIAGGAGITPFLSILRDLAQRGELGGQQLIYTNQTPRDIICEKELRHLLGERCRLVCTRESGPGYEQARVDRDFLGQAVTDFSVPFYICGPPALVKDLRRVLTDLGATSEQVIV